MTTAEQWRTRFDHSSDDETECCPSDEDGMVQRVCMCGGMWLSLHCPHDGYQGTCPDCGQRAFQITESPAQPREDARVRQVIVDCVFCDYAGPSPILDDYNDMIVIEPLDPVAPGHALIIPKRHCADAVADPELAGRVMLGAAHYAQERGFDSCNIITSAGSAATQTVPHLHVHVVPRRPGDGLRLPWSQ